MKYIPKLLFWLSVGVTSISVWAWIFYRHAFWGLAVLIGLMLAIAAAVLICIFKNEKPYEY